MDSTYVLATGGPARRGVRVRTFSVIAATALVLVAFALIQQPAAASPAGLTVGNAVPQFANFICGLLLSLFSAFQNSPFFSFIAPFLNSVLSTFGCEISLG